MLNRVFRLSALMWAASGLTVQPLSAQSKPVPPSTVQTWDLPYGTVVKDASSRTYRFTVGYDSANRTGEVVHRQRVTRDYTRGLANGEVERRNVGVADAGGATAPFSAARICDFIEGLRYPAASTDTLKPDSFKSFPPTAILERSLIWDTSVMEAFGQNHFDLLKLNVPLHILADQNVNMPGVGTFHSRDTVLGWVGRSERNGQDCAHRLPGISQSC
ncbi:MAG: hypothetical protein ABSD96_22195 [Candidatus Korobacteraceae bacterium]